MNLPSMPTAGANSAHRLVWLLLLAAVFCLVSSGAVFAQDDDDDDDDDGGGAVTTSAPADAEAPPYVLPYALVIACVGLGTLLVCRSANRHSLTKKWKPIGLFGAREVAEEEGKKAGPAPRTRQVSKDAQMGLYISIAGVVPVVGLFLGAFGLWKSVQAKKLIAQNRLLSGEGMALAGIIVGAIMIVVQVVVTVVILIKALS